MARDSVFISYRHGDASAQAGRLHAELRSRFGDERVFFDTGRIEGGDNFEKCIAGALDRARVVLVVMGKGWLLAAYENGKRRIDDLEDWVHREVSIALAAGEEVVTVVPVLVDPLPTVPKKTDLPEPIALLASRQALPLQHAQFALHAQQIVERIRALGVEDATSTKSRASPLPIDEGDLARYREACEAAHASLELAGFQTRLRVPIDLEELHVPLHASVDLRGQGEAARTDVGDTHAIQLSDAFREASRRKRRGLVILGDPGSGKTTQLKRLLLRLLRQGGSELGLESENGNAPGSPLPVFVRLRELPEAYPRLEWFIEQQIEGVHPDLSADFGKSLLRHRSLLLLFDGLDEVANPQSRAAVARSIEKLTRQRGKCIAVVTCRFAGYSGHAQLDEQFLELQLRPLTPEQADQFIRNWYHIVETGLSTDPARGQVLAQERAAALVERLREPDFRTARLVAMTRNPLLLANLCLVHRDRGTLPKGRERLYDECIEVLLERWRESKQLAVAVSSKVGRRVLQPAALWLHGQKGNGEAGGRTRATAAELAPVLEPALKAARWQGGSAADFLSTVRDESGLLTGWGPEQFGFMHLGFQEYLAASEVRRRASEGDAQPLKELAAQYGVSWWQEVILVLLSIGNPSMFERFMREVVQQRAFGETLEPMGLLLEEAVEVSEVPFVELLAAAPGNDQEELWRRQLNALRVLERMGARQAIDALRERLAKHPFEEISALFKPRARATPAVSESATLRHEQTGIELVRIRGGNFQMGSLKGRREERPRHHVTVPEFYLGKHPVTNEQYGRYLQARPEAKEPEYWADRRYNHARQPVVGLTWTDAQTFAEWAGLRLPTEAEWEYACRAGRETNYSSGDLEQDLARVGWFSGNSEGRMHEVGEKPPNAFGVCDMHGNVWEWCSDWLGAYSDQRATNPRGPAQGVYRVFRGGSSRHSAEDARSSRRSGDDPAFRYGTVGFRVARGPKPANSGG